MFRQHNYGIWSRHFSKCKFYFFFWHLDLMIYVKGIEI